MTGEWEMNTTNQEDWKPGGQAYRASVQCQCVAELHPAVTPITRFDREKDVYQLTHGAYHFRLRKGFAMLGGSER
jgi:hypothetical protein